MKRVLILSPRFAPDIAADNQRVHQIVPWLAKHGWSAFVACVDCQDTGLPQSAQLAAKLAPHVQLRRSASTPLRFTKPFGIGSLSIRSFSHLDRMVRTWHQEQKFDVVFVSTTEFGLWPLARRWKQALGLPYVLDWQDPWWSDYFVGRPHLRPPGGRLKYGVQQWLARQREPAVATAATHHICVSTHYVRMLRRRYPEIPESRFSVIPFPSAPPVMSRAAVARVGEGRYWAYAGRGGDDMVFALKALFEAVAIARRASPARFAELHLRFLGTSYMHPDVATKSVAPIADACGVGDMVDEQPARVTSERVEEFLAGAEAIIVPGSDDPGYVASKIQTCLAMGKPMLALFHAESDVLDTLAAQPGVIAIGFDPERPDGRQRLLDSIASLWLQLDPASLPVAPRTLHFNTPEAVAARIARVLDASLVGAGP